MELLQIDIAGGDFFLEVPARISAELPEEYTDTGFERAKSGDSDDISRTPSAEDGRDAFVRGASGLDSTRWLVSLPAQEVDYPTLAGSGYAAGEGGALLTRRKPGKDGEMHTDTAAWHREPKPPSYKIKDDMQNVRIRFSGPSLPPVKAMILEDQQFEMPSKGTFMVKKLLNGRIILLLKRLPFTGKYRAVLSEGEFIKYEKLFKKFDENGNGILTSAEVTIDGRRAWLDANKLATSFHYQKLILEHMAKAEHRGEESGMTFDSMVELLERDHQGGKAWFVTGVAVNLPESADFKDVEATIHLEQAALEFDDRVSAVWEEEDTLKQGFVTLFQTQEAFGRLMLPTFDEEIDQILEPFRDSGQVSEAGFFRIMRYEFRNAKISWAEYKVVRQAKERQRIAARARARLLLYKGTVNKVRETVVACSYKSINSGDVFLLDGYYSLFLWIGKFAGDHEAEAGKEGMERLVQQRRGMEVSETIVREGHEPTDFWFVLGGYGQIARYTEAVSDDLAEGLPAPLPAIPSPRKEMVRICIVGAGVAGASCAKTIKEMLAVEVVVIESAKAPGGRCGAVQRSGVEFAAGGVPYFTASGPHLGPLITDLIASAAIHEWCPRIGVISRCGIGQPNEPTLVPAMETIEKEVNIEAWLRSRPKTGGPSLLHQPPPATAFAANPAQGIPRHDLEAPNPRHRRSHAHARAQGHGGSPWYIGRPDMSALVSHLLKGTEVRTGGRVQALSPKLGQGLYEVIIEDAKTGKFDNAGLFDMVLMCVPHEEASRLLSDVQPNLAALPHTASVLPVWVVLVGFDHPVFTPFDVITVDDEVDSPVRFAFREASRLSSADPFQVSTTVPDENPMINNFLHPKETNARLWGKKTPGVTRPRAPPAMTVYGAPVDKWVIHMSSEWSLEHRDTLAKQVCEVGVSALLKLLGMPDAQLRVVVSDAILWNQAIVSEPASTSSIRPDADPAFGPYCIFDPVTGVGAAGDWCVDGSVEGAFVSGRELAARACKSPIMFKEGQSNPLGPVQLELLHKVGHRTRAMPEGGEVVSGYSADSRPSTARGSQGWDELDWPDQLLLKAVTETHGMAAESSQEVMRKTALCLNDGCNQWVDKTRLDEHRRCCPYRRARKCPFFDCAKWVEADQLEAHKNTCEFGLRVECEWCFKQVAQPDTDSHRRSCLARPRTEELE